MKPIQEEHTMIARTKTGPAARGPAILLYLMLSLLLTLTACEEPIGNQGPQGPQGPQGLEGPEGPVGPAGEDGSMIYAGYGPPSTDIGSPGDYYLNGTTGELYGPKTDDGWGGPILILKGEDGQDGADGQNGEDGSQIHAGSGAPGDDLGKEGDFYLDTASYGLYGPKTGNEENPWGNPINLQRPMIYTQWFVVEDDFAAQRDTIIAGTFSKVIDKTVPQLTSTILNEGVIMVYMRFSGAVYALPYQSNSGGKPSTLDFHTRVRIVYITRFFHDNTGPPRISRGFFFRFVLIPGGAANKMKRPDGFWDDYEAVAEYYGIPD